MKIIITEEQKNNLFVINEVRVKESDRVKLYEDDKLLVVVPLTHKASCKYGANTPWCVAVPSEDEHFNEYTNNGILIYFIIKSPYDYGDIKEYKFAYYHSYLIPEDSGWFDMSDYKYEVNNPKDEGGEIPDIKLLKFLVPKKVMKMVHDYIEVEEPNHNRKVKERKKFIYNLMISDPNNHKIVDDKDWVIMYRTIEFSTEYQSLNIYFPTPNKGNELFIIYVSKDNHILYRQTFPYYIDIRSYVKTKKELPKIYSFDGYDDGNNEEMVSVFKKYFKKIALVFFKERKENYNPNERDYMYLYPEYVKVGDILGGGDNKVVINIQPITGSYKPYTIDAQYSGEITKDIYYNTDIGVAMKYNKEKHNPITI